MQTYSTGGSPADSILKYDLHRGQTTAWRLGTGKRVGEFVFVPHAPQAPKDDGLLMGFVYDASTDRSDLVILDAASLETIAAIHLPQRVPDGFHGNWAPAAP